jgi:TolB-like protein
MTSPDIFLSYSREDQATARRFAQALEAEGFSVWWDQTLNPGEDYDSVTENALLGSKAVVVLWSKQSVGSRWVRAEATLADRAGKLLPVMIESCSRPIMFELKQTSDLSHWEGDRNDPVWRAYASGVRRHVHKDEATGSRALPGSASALVTGDGARRSKLRWGVLAAVVLLVVGAGALWRFNRGATVPGAAAPAAAATAAQSVPVTLAVLPFADLSAAHDQEYFADGLTEEILNQLAHIRELTVTGRTSSFSFKGKNEDLRVIAQKLGVANLLEGSLRRDGTKLRITAQLIDGTSGAHKWSQTYARELSDVFTVQEEIAKDVARALSITLDVGSMSRAHGGTTNVDAYDKYLRARSLGLQGGVDASTQAVLLLREAVAIDPNFSQAWMDLGGELQSSAISLSGTEAASIQKEAAEAVERGVKLAPESRGAQVVHINRLAQQRKWAEALAAYAAFEKSEPLDSESLRGLGGGLGVLAATGRIADALRLAKRAQQIEPLSLGVSTDMQLLLYADGQTEAASKEIERSLGLEGNHQRVRFRQLLLLLSEHADPKVVQAQFRAVLEDQNVSAPFLRTLAGTITDRKASQAVLSKAFEDPANRDIARTLVIYQLADALGDPELALAALQNVIREYRLDAIIWVTPHSGLRSTPGFKALLRDVGLVDYFRASGNWGDFCKPVGAEDFECH